LEVTLHLIGYFFSLSSHKLKQCIFIVMSTDKKILLSLYGELDHCMEMCILSGFPVWTSTAKDMTV